MPSELNIKGQKKISRYLNGRFFGGATGTDLGLENERPAQFSTPVHFPLDSQHESRHLLAPVKKINSSLRNKLKRFFSSWNIDYCVCVFFNLFVPVGVATHHRKRYHCSFIHHSSKNCNERGKKSMEQKITNETSDPDGLAESVGEEPELDLESLLAAQLFLQVVFRKHQILSVTHILHHRCRWTLR